jgi:hypothetical protein
MGALPDYESILVNDVFYYMDRDYPWDYEYKEIEGEKVKVKKNPKRNQNLFLPVIGLRVNLYSSTAFNKKGEIRIVKRADKNDKAERKRPNDNQKDEQVIVTLAN